MTTTSQEHVKYKPSNEHFNNCQKDYYSYPYECFLLYNGTRLLAIAPKKGLKLILSILQVSLSYKTRVGQFNKLLSHDITNCPSMSRALDDLFERCSYKYCGIEPRL